MTSPELELRIAYPAPGVEVDPAEPLFVAGEAFLRLPSRAGLDAVLVIDVSASTGMFAGEDVDGDRWLDRSFAGRDSVLAAELLAAERVLAELAPSRARVALVAFSGRAPPGPGPLSPGIEQPARVVQPLTSDTSHVHAALARLRLEVPAGLTDMAAALDTALAALGRSPGVDRHRIVLLFTDGEPTSPYADGAANLAAALRAAARCREHDVQVHTFAIGELALRNPRAPIGIADETGGFFTPVERPSDLAGLATQVARQSIRRVRVLNRTTGDPATSLLLDFDGSWSALVPLRPGRNVIEVIAEAFSNRSSHRQIVVEARAGAPAPEIPAALRPRQAQLMEEQLSRLRQRTEALKARLRRELSETLAEERRQQERQRRELELRSEPGGR